jgi:hypothetical protein
MKTALLVLIICGLAFAQPPAAKTFDRLKTLAGAWTGSSPEGPVEVRFREASSGSAILSEIHSSQGYRNEMISVFHLDGGRLVMTHYCSVGNQPRMALTSAAGANTFKFEFFDATNLPDPEGGHMQRVVITIKDRDHHTEAWTFIDHGKESTATYDLRRAASNDHER